MTAATTPGLSAGQPVEDLQDPGASTGTDDAALTRSEEHLRVTTERVATSRVRVRKQIVTEMQTITVPVSREEFVIDSEPIVDGAAGSLPDAAEQGVEIILYAERPVVTMEIVAIERVRVSTTTVTEDRSVTERVGKEQIELHEEPLEPVRSADDPDFAVSDTASEPKQSS